MKDETQRAITATFEELAAELANTQATMGVRPAERFAQLASLEVRQAHQTVLGERF